MKTFIRLALLGTGLALSPVGHAQAIVESGKVLSIEIPVATEFACNIEVSRGGEKVDVAVDEKTKKALFNFTGQQVGTEIVRWEGKTKFRGLRSLVGCGGGGSFVVSTIDSAQEMQKAQQAARIAELESRLKAAEAEAAKTPEQKAEEARIAAEAKAFAEAKVAAEMRAAEKARADAEAKAAAEAKVAAAARAVAEAKALAERRAAEVARNKPLKKSELKEGVVYIGSNIDGCKDNSTTVCLSEIQSKQMCDWASGITVNAREMATFFASPQQFKEWLERGGDVMNTRYVWSDLFKSCMASWSVVGVYRGTNKREDVERNRVSKFVYSKSKEILIHDFKF